MNANGTAQTRLTFNSALDYRPAWSPDGSRIAFHTNRDGNLEIYVMNADGTAQTNLTHNPADDASPDWQPLPDGDGDGVPDVIDNCPDVANPGQENHDWDTMGDACDPDDDNDELTDGLDPCPLDHDCDDDGYWDGDETLKGSQPLNAASKPEHCDAVDNDGDTTVDEEPSGANWDIDGDTVKDCLDATVDTDGDGVVNTVDTDDDGDGVTDARERWMTTDELGACPTGASHDAWASDANGDRSVLTGDVIKLFFGRCSASARRSRSRTARAARWTTSTSSGARR